MPQLRISTRGIDDIVKQLEKNAALARKVLTATGNDMRARVPGWVASEVTGDYNIKKSEIMPAKKDKNGNWKKTAGGVNVRGTTVSSVEIAYTGRTLTPTHFGMKPKKLTATTKGKRRKRQPITAEIKKGQRKTLHPDAFLGSNNGGGYIPFRRTGPKPYPIEAIKTLSLPQMIQNEIVYNRIERTINTELSKRLEHNINRFMK